MTTDPQPQALTNGPTKTSPASPKRRTALVVVLLLAVFAVALAGGAALFLFIRASEPDRSTPDQAVDQFINAAVVERDPIRTGLFVCDEWPPAEAIQEGTAGVNSEVSVTWSAISVSPLGDARASAVVEVTYTMQGFSDVETWHLDVQKKSDWRVCGITREAITRSTPSSPATPG